MEDDDRDGLAAVNTLVQCVKTVCDRYVEVLSANIDLHRIVDSNREVSDAIDRRDDHPLRGRDRELFAKAQQDIDDLHAAEHALIPAVEKATATVSDSAVNELAAARALAEPIQWAIELRQRLSTITNLALWPWDDSTVTVQSRWDALGAIAAAISPVQHWLAMGAPRHAAATQMGPPPDPQIARLQWWLDKMIQALQTAPTSGALGSITSFEDHAAELIESTGLANELELPAELRPVFKRTDVDIDADGFPHTLVYSYTSPYGDFSVSRFDWFAASASADLQRDDPAFSRVVYERSVPADLVPSARFIADLLQCVKDWREYTSAPRPIKSADATVELKPPRGADGPAPPNLLVWKGKRHELPPRLWRMLWYMWSRDTVTLDEFEREVWDREAVRASTVNATISKLNTALLKANCPMTLHTKNGHVTKFFQVAD